MFKSNFFWNIRLLRKTQTPSEISRICINAKLNSPYVDKIKASIEVFLSLQIFIWVYFWYMYT